MEQSDDDQRKARVTETDGDSPDKSKEISLSLFSLSLCLCVSIKSFFLLAFTGSPHYSEDFEEEETGEKPLEEVCTWNL